MHIIGSCSPMKLIIDLRLATIECKDHCIRYTSFESMGLDFHTFCELYLVSVVAALRIQSVSFNLSVWIRELRLI